MDKISELFALSLLPLPDGILFAYCAEKTEESFRVGYKMVNFTSGKVSNVPKSVFMLSKFGPYYKTFEKKLKNYLSCFTLILEDGQVFIVERDGCATLFNAVGDEIWTGKLLYENTAPGGIATSGNSLWVSFPEHNALIRYNLKTLRQELRIGGSSSPFNKAEGLFPAGTKLFVCSKGSNSIWKLDVTNYSTELYYEFDEPVYNYLFIDKYEIVSLDSGIYLL